MSSGTSSAQFPFPPIFPTICRAFFGYVPFLCLLPTSHALQCAHDLLILGPARATRHTLQLLSPNWFRYAVVFEHAVTKKLTILLQDPKRHNGYIQFDMSLDSLESRSNG